MENMCANELVFFENLRTEVRKLQAKPRMNFSLSASEGDGLSGLAADEYVVPECYVNYQAHINEINAFKKNVTDPKMLKDLVELLKVGPTIEECRKYYGEINQEWNDWELTYSYLNKAAKSVGLSNEDILRHFDKALEALKVLMVTKDDPDALAKFHKNVCAIQTDDLGDINSYSDAAVKGLNSFYDSFDEQEASYHKMVKQLIKESTLQEEEKEKIQKRIDKLKGDISSYNAAIAAIAIGMGVSLSLVFLSVKVGWGFALVVAVFIIPAFVAMSMKLASLIADIKQAKDEIASYAGYEDKYNGIIGKLSEIQKDVEETKKQSAEVKKLVAEVISPWTSLRKDLDVLMTYISETENYKTAYSQFEEGKVLWIQIAANAEYLKMPEDVKVIMEEISVETTSVDEIVQLAQGEGITMQEYLRKRPA